MNLQQTDHFLSLANEIPILSIVSNFLISATGKSQTVFPGFPSFLGWLGPMIKANHAFELFKRISSYFYLMAL